MAVVVNGEMHDPQLDKSKRQPGFEKKYQPRRSYFRWFLALVIRLCIWYAVLTPFFHCPSNISQLEESTPRVCKPYLVARSYIEPHVEPYYEAYAAPYVELARPYAETFNERIYTPVSKVAKQGYDAYGAPALDRAGKYGHQQWEAVAVPQLRSIQNKANDLYTATIDPHVQQVIVLTSPYLGAVSTKASEVNEKYFQPLYVRSKPFIGKTYSSGQHILSGTVAPLVQKTWSSFLVFTKGTVWPSVTGLYSENVEPQLVKIGERLASYREGKKLRAVVDEYENSVDEPVPSTPLPSSAPESVVSSQATEASSTKETAETTTSLTPEQVIANAREQISADLYNWQQKFAAAADKGIEDLGDRIQGIVSSQLESGAKKHGESLVEALQTVTDHEISNMKVQINNIIKSLPESDEPQQEEKAIDDLLKVIRSAGVAVRDRAQALREWYNGFDQELVRRVTAATDSTLDVLDGIRDLGLQEIGMRWAWMEGVTYKDWANYHALRKQFDDWRNEVYEFGLQHEKVEEAKAVTNDILSRGMEVAEDAAKELIRLRDVGRWKIEAREESDNFETRSEPPPLRVKPGTKDNDDSVSGTVDESPGDILSDDEAYGLDSTQTIQIKLATETESVPVAAQSEDISLDHSSVKVSPDLDDNASVEDNIFTAQSSTQKVWGGAAAQAVTNEGPILDDVVDDDTGSRFSSQIHNLVSEAGERYAEVTKAVSEALLHPSSTPNFGDQAASVASDQYFRAMAAASSVLYGTTPGPGEQLTSASSEKYSRAVAAASSAFYNFPLHATATTAGPLESISAVASSRLQEGLSAASAQYASLKASIRPSPTGLQDPILLDAQRRYYEAIGLAHDHYDAFVGSASRAIYGAPTATPLSGHLQSYLDDAKAQYNHVSSLASSSLAAVIASASSAVDSNGDTAHGIMDDANSRYSAAMSAASASLALASASASSAIYGTPTGSIEAATSKASENWESLISKASEQIYGTPTPFIQQLYDLQASRYHAVESLVSDLVVGREPDFTESVLNRLRSAYETPYPAVALSSASSYANDAYQSASSFVAAYATPVPTIEDILDAANDQLNSAVDAASVYVYGTPKGTYEQATSAAADAYSSASSQASEAVYGTQPGYVEAARSQVDAAFSSAQNAINTAIYGTPTGAAESAVSAASGAYASVTSAVGDSMSVAGSIVNSAYSNLQSQASSALLPEQQGALESATSRLAVAVESAQARLADLASNAGGYAAEVESKAASAADELGSSASSAASKIKDEL